jgi:hypothetical protein
VAGAPDAGLDEDDIQGFRRTEDGMRPVLSGAARLRLARENFEIDRDPRRVMAGTERVPVGLTEEDFEFELVGGEVRAGLTDEARAELRRRETNAPRREDPAADFDPPVSSVGGLGDAIGEFAGDVREEGFSTVERGGAASEVARDTAALGLSVGFDNPNEAWANPGIDVEERVGEFDLTSPSITRVGFGTRGTAPVEFSRDDPGSIDPGVASTIDTSTGGVLSGEQRESTGENVQQRRRFIEGGAAGVGEFVGELTGSATAESTVKGVGEGTADIAAAPGEALLAADTAARVGDDTPEAIKQEGFASTFLSGTAIAGGGLQTGIDYARDNPARAGARLGTGAVVGTAVVRGAGGARQRVANFRLKHRADATVDLEDLTTQRAIETGELPRFETSTGAPTRQAVGEVRRRARDQPAALQEAGRMSLSDAARFEAGRRVNRGIDRVGAATGGRAAAAGRRGLREAGRRVEGASIRAQQAIGRTRGRLESIGGGISGRAQAGIVRVGASSRAVAGRARGGVERVGQRANAVGGRAAEPVRAAGARVQTAADATGGAFAAGVAGGRQQFRQLDRAAFQAGERTGRAFGRLDQRAFEFGRGLGRRTSAVEDATVGRVDRAAFEAGERAGEGILATQQTIGRTRGRLTELGARVDDVTLGRFEQPAYRTGERVGERLAALDDAAFQAGRRVGEGSTRLEAATVGRLDDAAFAAGERFGGRLAEVDATAFDAGVRVGEAIPSTSDVPGGARLAALDDATLGRVDDAAFAVGEDAGAFVARTEQRADRGAIGESVLLRSESERLPQDLEATRGEYELPGLFAAPELSPLRLEQGQSRSLPRPRLPRPADFSPTRQRTSAFPGDRIEGMPAYAAESGRITRGGDPMPDPEAAGTRFLENQADEGTAYVRATGDRTSELEAIYPPGSTFQRQTELAIDLPEGGVASLDVYRRGRSPDADADDAATARGRQPGDADAEPVSGYEIAVRERRGTRTRPEGDPVTPPVPSATSTAGSAGAETSPLSDLTATSPTTSPAVSVGASSIMGESFGASSSPDTSASARPGGASAGGSGGSYDPSTPSTPRSYGFEEAGGGGGGGSGGGGGGGFVPPEFETTPVPDAEFEDTERGRNPFYGGRRDPEFTDFLNPLSGELLETERETVPTELDEPVFVGFDAPDPR